MLKLATNTRRRRFGGAVIFAILLRKYSYTLLALLMQPTDILDKNIGLILNLSLQIRKSTVPRDLAMTSSPCND